MPERCDTTPGPASTSPQGAPRLTAYDSEVARGLLINLSEEQIKQIPILTPGARIERDRTCLDLADPAVAESVVAAGTLVAENALLVPRGEVDDELWNKLRGEPAPTPTPGP